MFCTDWVHKCASIWHSEWCVHISVEEAQDGQRRRRCRAKGQMTRVGRGELRKKWHRGSNGGRSWEKNVCKSLICCTKCEVKPIFATFYKYCETGCSCKRLMVGSSVGQMGGWSLPHGREVLYLSTRIGVGLGWRGRVDFGDGLRDVYKLGEGRTQWCKLLHLNYLRRRYRV